MAGLIVIVILAVIIAWLASIKNAERQRREAFEREQAERRRIEACGEVVLFFANHLGYIARSVISREELAALIDQGISAPKLAEEIHQRIEQIDGLVLGYHPFGEVGLDVKLTDEMRQRHVYVIGKSGYGKTNLLRGIIFQDIEAGGGVGVIAPEQEMLTEEILPYIPRDRADDVIYFNPADTACPVSFNPLHLDEGEDLDLKVDETLTIFLRLLGEPGPRMGEILRQALYALTGREGATLLDVERLLEPHDSSLRNEIIRTSRDPQVVHFWRDIYPTLPKDAHLPITTRLGRFVRPKVIRNVLCNPGASLNFSEAMDAGRIMLFNLSDGVLGEQNSQLLGQLIVSKFQQAVMARARQSKHQRRRFALYIDEFQTFTGTSQTSYEKMLSRARKYRLSLVLAHQQTGQLPSGLLKEILGNVSTTICFQVSREDAVKFSREFITLYDGEVINIPEEEILKLKVGQAICKIGQHSFFMQTYLADQHPDTRWASAIIERSRLNYGSPPTLMLPAGSEAEAGGEDEPVALPQAGKALQQPRQVKRSAVDELLKDIDPGNVFGE
jgi:hypothetical protein